MKFLSFIILTFMLTACDEPRAYYLLYPIEASKQDVLRLQGYRFLSSNLDSPASIIVLSNPVENGGFADFAFAITNNSDKTIHLSEEDFTIKMREKGELELLSSRAYDQAKVYKKPEGFDRLAPKMQAFGCAAANTEDNIHTAAFNASQSWVWDKHLRYPFKEPELYLKGLEIPAAQTRGAVFRIAFPELAESFEQSTILVQLKVPGHDEYRFKFILQSLR